jgi:hypothetical protein
VRLSTHYYVISVSEHSNALFEVFRDVVIDIRNGGFPVEVPPREPSTSDFTVREEQLREALQAVDQRFGHCYRHDPLKLVLVGEKEIRDIFTSLTAYRNEIVGYVDGNFSTTSPYDLGKIVWPVVREAISGVQDEAMRDLEAASIARRTVCGLPAVGRKALAGVKATLLVEDDYHMRGSFQKTNLSLEISQDVNVLEEIDDAVDLVIEKVLKSGGNVVFTPNGTLHKHERIVLLVRET